MTDVSTLMSGMVNRPSLPPGTTLTAEEITANSNEFLSNPAINKQAPTASTQTAAATNVNANPIVNGVAGYQVTAANASGNTPHMEGVTEELDPRATVQNQMAGLMSQFDGGNTPEWARGALQNVNEQMASRGLGASSIAAGASVEAAMRSALPIAQADAAAYQARQQGNIANLQEARRLNQQTRLQTLLSDQAAENAARQFNAQNVTQVQTFRANLAAQIEQFNSAQANAISQFNAGQSNEASRFNAQLQDQRDRFYAENQLLIDQSNVQWRRNINTANTAARNAANQTNVTNRLAISNTALNNLWQQYRDEASWAFTASQNELDRSYNLAAAALERDFLNKQMSKSQRNSLLSALGRFGTNVLNNALSGK